MSDLPKPCQCECYKCYQYQEDIRWRNGRDTPDYRRCNDVAQHDCPGWPSEESTPFCAFSAGEMVICKECLDTCCRCGKTVCVRCSNKKCCTPTCYQCFYPSIPTQFCTRCGHARRETENFIRYVKRKTHVITDICQACFAKVERKTLRFCAKCGGPNDQWYHNCILCTPFLEATKE